MLLERYIGRSVLGATLGVLSVLVGLDALSALIDELGDAKPGYGLPEITEYVGLTLPRRIEEFVPFAALIGALIALGRLAGASELVVVRAAGVSLGRLSLMVLRPALIVAFLGLIIGEFIAPVTEQMAVSHRVLAQRADASFTSEAGTWNRDGDTFIHVAAVQRGGLAFGVTLMTFGPDQQLVKSLYAERGTFLNDYWLLENVSVTELAVAPLTTEHLTTWRWDTGITPELLVLEVVKNESLPIRQLWQYGNYLKDQGLKSGDVELTFWRKVMQPLAVAGLVLVAMSFIFGPLREGNMGARIFAGVVVGVLFRISQDFFGPASLIFGFHAVIAALMPILLCWLAGAWLLLRRA